MALIVCGDCQKNYSDYASACPQCARPTISQIKQIDKNPKEFSLDKNQAKLGRENNDKDSSETKKDSKNEIDIESLKATNDNNLLRSYLRDIARVPLLSHEQEITYGRQVQECMQVEKAEQEIIELTGDKPSIEELANKLNLSTSTIEKRLKVGKNAKERMVAANLSLVVAIAKRYIKTDDDIELLDLIQEGTIALVRGVEKFDPARGYKLSTYVYWWIRQGLIRSISEKMRAIRPPIYITEMLNKLKRGQRELSQELSRTPTLSELAKYVELPEEDVKDFMCKAGQLVSLETKADDGEDTVLLDLLNGNGDLKVEILEETNCMRGDLHSLLHQLPDLQCRVLRMRYGIDGDEPMSLSGIGDVLGISKDRVRNLERDGLKGLRSLSDNVEDYLREF